MSNILRVITKRTAWKRTAFFVVSDLIIITVAVYSAFLLRFDNDIPTSQTNAIKTLLLASYIIVIPVFYLVKLYAFSWSFIGTKDLINLIKGLSFSYIIISLFLYFTAMELRRYVFYLIFCALAT